MATPSGIICEFISTTKSSISDNTVYERIWTNEAIIHGSATIDLVNDKTLTIIGWADAGVNRFAFTPSNDRAGMFFRADQRAFQNSSVYIVIGANVVELSFLELEGGSNQWAVYTAARRPNWVVGNTRFGFVIADAGQSVLVQKYVANNLQDVDVDPPMLVGGSANGRDITLNFNETLTGTANRQRWEIRVNSNIRGASGITVSGKTVKLRLSAANAIQHGDVVTIQYNQVVGGLQDSAGNLLKSFAQTAITNNTANPALPLYFGATQVSKLYYGSNEVTKMYFGDKLVFKK